MFRQYEIFFLFINIITYVLKGELFLDKNTIAKVGYLPCWEFDPIVLCLFKCSSEQILKII